MMCEELYHENLAENMVFLSHCTRLYRKFKKLQIQKGLRSYSDVQEILPQKLSRKKGFFGTKLIAHDCTEIQ